MVSTANNTLVDEMPVGINSHMVAFGGLARYSYVTNASVIDTHVRRMRLLSSFESTKRLVLDTQAAE